MVRAASTMNAVLKKQSHRIDQNRSLPPLDFLSSITAFLLSGCRCINWLAINIDYSRRFAISENCEISSTIGTQFVASGRWHCRQLTWKVFGVARPVWYLGDESLKDATGHESGHCDCLLCHFWGLVIAPFTLELDFSNQF